MICGITRGHDKTCKSQNGGIKKVYIFTYVKYKRSQIDTTNLVLNSFPETNIYEFEPLKGITVNQKMDDDDGGKYYTQTIDLRFSGTQDTFILQKIIKKDVRIIVEDNNGNLRLLGAYNGLICESINSETGGSKSEFNGLTFSFTGDERNEALFINDLSDVGFFRGFLLLEDGFYILLEDGSKIEL